jgi:hypothetical protein
VSIACVRLRYAFQIKIALRAGVGEVIASATFDKRPQGGDAGPTPVGPQHLVSFLAQCAYDIFDEELNYV